MTARFNVEGFILETGSREVQPKLPAYYSPHPGSRADRSVLPWR
jgi:hypothetical protein